MHITFFICFFAYCSLLPSPTQLTALTDVPPFSQSLIFEPCPLLHKWIKPWFDPGLRRLAWSSHLKILSTSTNIDWHVWRAGWMGGHGVKPDVSEHILWGVRRKEKIRIHEWSEKVVLGKNYFWVWVRWCGREGCYLELSNEGRKQLKTGLRTRPFQILRKTLHKAPNTHCKSKIQCHKSSIRKLGSMKIQWW